MTNWVKCADELPPENTPVFVTSGSNIYTALLSLDCDGWYWNMSGYRSIINDPESYYDDGDDYVFDCWAPMIEPPAYK